MTICFHQHEEYVGNIGRLVLYSQTMYARPMWWNFYRPDKIVRCANQIKKNTLIFGFDFNFKTKEKQKFGIFLYETVVNGDS